MSKQTLIQIVFGVAGFVFIWFFLLPLLTGIIHTIVATVVVVLVIIWILYLAGIIK